MDNFFKRSFLEPFALGYRRRICFFDRSCFDPSARTATGQAELTSMLCLWGVLRQRLRCIAIAAHADTEEVFQLLEEAVLLRRRRVAGDERILARAFALGLRALPRARVHPRELDTGARRGRQRARRQFLEDALPYAQRAGGAPQAGRLVVVAADPHHAQMLAAETGEPGIALAVGGAGLAGDMQPRK